MENTKGVGSSDALEESRKSSLRSRKLEKNAEMNAEKNEDIEKKQKEKNRLKVKAWRMRQKTENSTKYSEIKKKDTERKKEARMKVKLMANSDPELKASLRKKKAEEMKRYRQRKKMKTTCSSEDPGVKKSKKPALEEKKKKAVKRTQAWRMRIKLKSPTIPIVNTVDENDSHGESRQNKSNLSRATIYRRAQMVKGILPRTPKKKAAILKKLIESPSTSKVLSDQGVTMTPACKKKLEVADAIVNSLKESISEVNIGVRKDREKKHAYDVIRESVLRKYKKITVSKYFNVSYKTRKMRNEWWKMKQRKTRCDVISDHVKQSVKEFYLGAEISREVPSKRDVVRIKTQPGMKETLQKHVMTMTLEEAHKLYKTRNPNHKIGLTSFSKLKPVNVKKVSETSRRSCLCQTCCNVALKVEALTTLKRVVKETDMTEDIKIDKKSLSDATFCSYEQEPSLKCVSRNCEKCGVQGLQKYLATMEEKNRDGMVSWYQWESIEIKKYDKVKRCISCVPKEADFKVFLTALEKDMMVYPEHAFRASWQQKQMGVCVEKLTKGSVAMVMDFSENYACVFQSEVQSGFFDRNQVTVHPMMCYYKESLDDKDVTVKHAIIGISEETKHDADLAIVFENQAIKLLESRGVKIGELHEWTDGCAAQYKGKKAFADISLRKQPKMTRNYFETSHGKNVCDGLGATVKNACYRAVISNRKVLDIVNKWEKRNLDVISKVQEKLNVKKKQPSNKEQPKATCKEQTKGQKQITLKRKSETKQPKAKRRKIEETAATTSQQDTAFQPGDFVTVGLKPRKGPISVYVAEITSKSETEYGLKYMKKAGNAYVWPEKSDVSQEPTEHFISKLEAPELVNERGHFKFNTQELSKVKVNLLKIHKHVYFK
ncbi:uncharacterized protein LOC128223902 [Mya arenaria]|uniref:uncharacterized protein LOC128223902 n=1 Tax=Mya arenaria TaxID=6604 RepID=UPI0022E86ACD|nr:uncharacterized protein LOC128223902 [Mya arenaria]